MVVKPLVPSTPSKNRKGQGGRLIQNHTKHLHYPLYFYAEAKRINFQQDYNYDIGQEHNKITALYQVRIEVMRAE